MAKVLLFSMSGDFDKCGLSTLQDGLLVLFFVIYREEGLGI